MCEQLLYFSSSRSLPFLDQTGCDLLSHLWRIGGIWGKRVLTWEVQSGSSTHKLYSGDALTSLGRKDLSQHETDLRLLHWGHHPEEEEGKGTPGGEGDQRGSLTSK